MAEIRFEFGKRWVSAQVALEKPKGGAWSRRCPGRPWNLEEQWRKAATDDERSAVLQRERAEREALEDLGATAPRPR